MGRVETEQQQKTRESMAARSQVEGRQKMEKNSELPSDPCAYR